MIQVYENPIPNLSACIPMVSNACRPGVFRGSTSCYQNFTAMNTTNRKSNLMPSGIPKYVRCYDNGGETFDRYTVVFTGRYTHKTNGVFWYVGMSGNPFHPQGFGQHGETKFHPVDRPRYGHIGKKIKFTDLPEDCRKLIVDDYTYLWDIK